ncbi:BTAD domain-containing putative transcriptional regulator [Nocardioides sp. 503]|uniref:BTAD domain-containing putative transcriptional regulator n=1 Tax=Nocardioides sp. 503 TaxID=2508326 RepID=UPI00143102A1|nr:BTAD domain-containing putative transcriptional regulator [Nocardioides sp. 503]
MIRVLGPLAVTDSTGARLDIGSPRHREVLAALLVDAGRVVSTDALLERVWGDGTRGATTANLHAVISRLRGRLADSPGVEVVTAPPGYRLEAPGAVDAVTFEERLAAARQAAATGDRRGARVLVRDALDLWHGPAYADIHRPFALAEAARLDGQRLAAHELAAELDLALGDHDAAVETLSRLVLEQPLREAFRARLMTALYRAGRQADALATYAAGREALAEELGLDPGPGLQELHQRILEQDPALLGPERSEPAAARTTRPSTPHPPEPVDPGPAPPLTALLGREREVEYVTALVEESAPRLVTLTGVGGVGKTRLALAVATAARPSFPDSVAVVHLAGLTDPAAVLPAIGRATGLPAVEGLDAFAAVVQHLRPRRALVVLDNAEHLLEAGPRIGQLVASCPHLTVLVTSRTSLRITGESEFQVSPLPLPEAGHADLTASSPAVSLFVERATSVSTRFTLTAGNAIEVGAICRRLAGIPLAIELAAARTRLLSPAAILERLDEVMAGAGARDLPARQRTMHATIDWSYRLLEPEEQRVFRQLSVFVDGFTLDAAREVVSSSAPVLTVLESLVEQSLVVPDLDPGPLPRFRLLEPVRQHAHSLLDPTEAAAVDAAHLTYFLRLATDTEPSFRGPGTVEGLALVEREHANFVAAVERAVAAGRSDRAAWLCWALWLFWWLRGDLAEGRRLLEAVLSTRVEDAARLRAMAALGAMTFAQGDLLAARVWAAGAELGAAVGDTEGQGHCVAGTGLLALAEGDLATADRRFEQATFLCEERGWLWTLTHVWRGTVRLLQGRPGEAGSLLAVALAAAREREDRLAIYVALFTSAQVSLELDDRVAARAQLAEGIALSQDTGDLANLAYFLDMLAVVESLDGRLTRVPVLHGSAQHVREVVGADVYGYYQPDEVLLAQALTGSREVLGDRAFDEAVGTGRRMSVDEVVAYAGSS